METFCRRLTVETLSTVATFLQKTPTWKRLVLFGHTSTWKRSVKTGCVSTSRNVSTWLHPGRRGSKRFHVAGKAHTWKRSGAGDTWKRLFLRHKTTRGHMVVLRERLHVETFCLRRNVSTSTHLSEKWGRKNRLPHSAPNFHLAGLPLTFTSPWKRSQRFQVDVETSGNASTVRHLRKTFRRTAFQVNGMPTHPNVSTGRHRPETFPR